MEAFVVHKSKMPDGDDQWFFKNRAGSEIGPFATEEAAGGAAEAARQEWLAARRRRAALEDGPGGL